MKQLSILGSTGSIGRNTLRIVEMFPDRFRVRALAAGTNVALLAEQIIRFRPDLAVVIDSRRAEDLKERIPTEAGMQILWGAQGYQAAAAHESVDTVVAAMVGAAGLLPALAAVEAGKTIALANKETLVMAGEFVMTQAARKAVRILPVDSEHSAIFQCLAGQRRQDLAGIYLTASGGPFLNKPLCELKSISVAEALNHPTWNMGPKISIDSATLMNKGLEVIEAQHLFGVSADQVEVLIHPQSLIHSMVSFQDGSVMAQIGIPDMMGAIAYALSYPERLPLRQPTPDFVGIGMLKFRRLNRKKFPCLELAIAAGRQGGTLPTVLNAANEAAVGAFLGHKIGFVEIVAVIEETMSRHVVTLQPDLGEILAADGWARREAKTVIRRMES